MVHKVLTLNNISPAGLGRLGDQYRVGSDLSDPDVVLLRSFNMRDLSIPSNLKVVGRAGAGVNNVPVEQLTQRGIPVFNAPGANANAVKELVVAGILLAARNICQSWAYTRNLSGTDEEIDQAVEGGKKHFAGFELPGKTWVWSD